MLNDFRFRWLALAIVILPQTVMAQRTLEHDAVIHAPIENVWHAFTTSHGLKALGVAQAEVDLRVGGHMKTHYDPEGVLGDPHTIVNEILAFEPLRMLAIRNIKAPEGFLNAEQFQSTWSVTYFEPVDDLRDRTRVRIVGLGWGDGPEWDKVYRFFEVGNAQTLQSLQKHFDPNTKADDPDRVMRLLGNLVGGEWIHEATPAGALEGSVFRVRNVIEFGPDAKSLMMRGWLGNQDGMAAHSACLVWLQPGNSASNAAAEVRFRNIDEESGVVAGSIRLVGSDTVEWDWNRLGRDGERSQFRVTMSFVAEDVYAMQIVRILDDGTVRPMVEADFRRVTSAPEEFRRLRD